MSMVMTLQKALEVDFLDEEFSRLTKPQAQNALVGQKVGIAVALRCHQEFFKSVALNNENITQMERSPWKRCVSCSVFCVVALKKATSIAGNVTLAIPQAIPIWSSKWR